MTSFYYNYQNSSVFFVLVLVQIRAIVLSTGLTNLNKKAKKMNSGGCSQMSLSWKWGPIAA